MSGLGRLQPSDWDHVAKFPLNALKAVPQPEEVVSAEPATADLRPTGVPVVLGTNWYTAMDSPIKQDGYYYIQDGDVGSIRGGHCYCLEPANDPNHPGPEQDNAAWWEWYNQVDEGACVGEGNSRAMSLYHRKQFDAFWLYDQARILDGHPTEEGSQVRSGLEVLRTKGHRIGHGKVNVRTETDDAADLAYGIKVYRWATTVEDILHSLGTPDAQFVTILNSWGKEYPHKVRLPLAFLHRLLSESGEAAVITEQ